MTRARSSLLIGGAILAAYAAFVWYPVLEFEFLRAFEPFWLGAAKNRFDFIEMYKSHSYFYYLDYKLFGWNPRGWYFTGLVAHIVGTLAFLGLLRKVMDEFGAGPELGDFIPVYGLVFIGSFVYLDVVSWGSFNSYYGVLLFLESIVVLEFLKYEKEKRPFFGLISCLAYFEALLIRETAVFAVVLIAALIVLRDQGRWTSGRKISSLKDLVRKLAPYAGVTLAFLLFRNALGGVTGDMNDENVRSRLNLLANKEYLELSWRIGMTFFRNVPTLFIPFQWLNDLRMDLTFKHGGTRFITDYFFAAAGLAVYAPLTVLCWRRFLKGKDPVGRLAVLAWTIITFALLLIAVAIPMADPVMRTQYDLFTRRYNYMAFLGAAILWTLLLLKIASLRKRPDGALHSRRLLAAATAAVLVFNFVMLRSTLATVYKQEHAEYKQFKADFKKISRDFNPGTWIYYHPHSSDINDYLFSMSLTKSWVYREVNAADSITVNVESQLGRMFQKLSKKRVEERNAVFLSYSKKDGLVNYTDRILALYRQKTKIPLTPNVTKALDGGPEAFFSDIPYGIELEVDKGGYGAAGGDHEDFLEWYRTLVVKAGPTLSQREGEPFLHHAPENAVDFTLSPDFQWSADGYTNFFELAGAKQTDIYGLWVIAPAKEYLPSVYEVTYRANRRIPCEQTLKPWGMLITFKDKVNAKRVRLEIAHTYQHYPVISEINIMTKSIFTAVNRGLEIPAIMDRIKSDGSPSGFWVTVEYVLADGEREKVRRVSRFVGMDRNGARCLIPLQETEARSEGLDKFLKVRYKSIKVSIPKHVKVKGLNFAAHY
jgi:hypothetical protein